MNPGQGGSPDGTASMVWVAPVATRPPRSSSRSSQGDPILSSARLRGRPRRARPPERGEVASLRVCASSPAVGTVPSGQALVRILARYAVWSRPARAGRHRAWRPVPLARHVPPPHRRACPSVSHRQPKSRYCREIPLSPYIYLSINGWLDTRLAGCRGCIGPRGGG